MTIASALFCLGFALLIALGLFALGLVLAASCFAIIAAGKDITRSTQRCYNLLRNSWSNLGHSGRQFTQCWAGVILCCALALGNVLLPRPGHTGLLWDGFDLFGLALCLPAAVQIVERRGHKRGTSN